MPRAVEPIPAPQEPNPHRIRWSRSQCEAIRDAGILPGRYELIDGEIISKMGQKPLHSVALVLLHACLAALFGALFVRIQSTIDVGEADPEHNEPEPDAAVTLQPAASYSTRHPGPEELLLVAEVSDTSLRFDRGVKALLYARAGIREYWVLDVNGRSLYVHRQPGQNGYAEIVQFTENEAVSPLARLGNPVSVAEMLPPAA